MLRSISRALLVLLFIPALAWADIAFVAKSESTPASANTCSVTVPTGTLTGHLMIMQIGVRNDRTVSDETGWLSVGSENRINGTALRSRLMYRVATLADESLPTYTFDLSDTGVNICAITTFSGVDTTSPIGASDGQTNSADTTVTSPGITPAAANSMILMFATVGDNNTQSDYAVAVSDPGTWAESYDVSTELGNDMALSMGYAIRAEVTGTGNGTCTTSGSDISVGHLVSLSPSTAATPTPTITNTPTATHTPTNTHTPTETPTPGGIRTLATTGVGIEAPRIPLMPLPVPLFELRMQ